MILLSNIKPFVEYLDYITDSLNIEEGEVCELREEWYQHLVELMEDFIDKGVSRDEAIYLAIKQFGDVPLLKSEVNRSYPSSRRLNFIKELIVWFICLIASSIGPSLLINAHYRIFFSIGPIFILGICYGLYHFVLKKLKSYYIMSVALPLLYGYFIYFIVTKDSFSYFVAELLNFRLGGNGLFTISMLHLLWGLVIAKHLFITSFNKQLFLNIVEASFQYWSMIMIAIFISFTELLTNSGEGKVITDNIFLLYVFLQQVIEPKIFIRSNNMIKHWLKLKT